MNPAYMDRYQSRASDGHPTQPLLEEFAGAVSSSLGGTWSPAEIISLLRQPTASLSVVKGLRALEELERAGNGCSEAMLLRAVVPDLRDVPDLSPVGISSIRESITRQLQGRESSTTGSGRLSTVIEHRLQQMRERRQARAIFLDEVKARLEAGLSRHLQLWADYLEMKAETNETHCTYRGTCFVWFARIGFSPCEWVSPFANS